MKGTLLLLVAFTILSISSFSQVTNGLTAWYPFDGNANDSIAANNGTVQGATLTTDRFGCPGRAYLFDSAYRITVFDNPAVTFNNSGDFTISFWMKISPGNIRNAAPIVKHFPGYWNGYWFSLHSDNSGYCNGVGVFNFYTASGVFTDACADSPIANDTTSWQMITGIYKGSLNRSYLYVNAQVQSDMGSVSGNLTNTADLVFGDAYKGKLDDIRFYKRALTQIEIDSLYNAVGPDAAIAGIITADTSMVCSGATAQLTLTGNNGIPKWQSSFNDSTFTDIPGALGATYTASNLQQTTWFRVLVTGDCDVDSSTSKMIKVIPHSVAGSISPALDTICLGEQTSLTAQGFTGSIQWQSSLTANNFSNIPGINDSTYLVQPSGDTYFRIVVDTGFCSDTSLPAYIMVNHFSLPALTASDTLICSGDSALICAPTGNYQYNWNTQDTSSCTTAYQTGGYWLTITDENGCSAISGHQDINVFPVPSVSIVVQGDTLASFDAVSYQWFANDTAITGATHSVYVANRTGDYAVQITDTNGCKSLSNTVPIAITGMEDLELGRHIELYPNPVADRLHFKNYPLQEYVLQIHNILGQLLLARSINFNLSEIDVSGLQPGIYSITFRTKDGIDGGLFVKE